MNMVRSLYVKINEARRITGIGIKLFRKMADEKNIRCYKTEAGTRIFDRKNFEKLFFNLPINEKVQDLKKKNYLYARVSSGSTVSKKQLDDLNRQIEFIKSKKLSYSSFTLITDIASGINFKRKGLSTILDTCLEGNIGEIVVCHRDRLSRFGFDLIDMIVKKAGGKITVINNEKVDISEKELSEDLLSIVQIYSCREPKNSGQMGRSGLWPSKYTIKTKISENTNLPKKSSEKNIK
jgi:putative resolvase